MLPGVHRVRMPRADGGATEFWYAWRGGPRILRASAKSDGLLDREIARLAPAAAAAFEALKHPKDDQFLFGLITKYLESDAFKGLSPRTQKDRRKFLDKVREELGPLELKALKAESARGMLLRWRKKYAATPKTADELLGALATALQWGVDEEECVANPLKDFPRLYKADRADVIWEPQHLAKLLPHCAPELNHAVRLAIHTGLRLGDLIELPWSAVGEHAIVWQTNKSRRRRTVVLPITRELRGLLGEIPRKDSLIILNSARGTPWTGSGLESALRRAKIDAGITGLRFHDFRGTAATNFVRAGLDLADVATVLGWKKAKVEDIAARYVTSEVIGLALVERMRRNEPKTKAVKRPVKDR